MMFKIGQKVVCVDDESRSPIVIPVRRWLKKDSIYTIRWIGPWGFPGEAIAICVRLEGIVRRSYPCSPEYNDMPFFAHRFRPLVEKETDISVFKALLNPVEEPV